MTTTTTPDIESAVQNRSGCPLHTMFAWAGEGTGSALSRWGVMAFGLVAYGAFFATILYAIGFVGNWIVPKGIDAGTASPLGVALGINTLLLSLFVVQHTIMARPAFKRWWTRFVPAPAERSIFVLTTCVCFGLLFWQWRPLPGLVWEIEAGWLRYAVAGVSLGGWGLVFLSSFLINHFDLFGLRQITLYFSGKKYTAVNFQITWLYRIVRHPLMVGFLVAFWAAPTMTVGRLFFAAMCTGYILMGTWFEERDLVRELGEPYRQYQRSVRGLIPLPKRQG